MEAERFERDLHLRHGELQPGQPLHLGPRELDQARGIGDFARERHGRGFAPAQLQDHLRGEFEPLHREAGIDAALEAEAGIRMDAERAAGAGDVERVPQRALDQHVDRRLRATRMLAAHDAGDRLRPVVVGDHHHLVGEIVGLAVERHHRLAGLGAAHDEVALHLRRVEDVQRPVHGVGHDVGDVDQRVDRPEPDRLEPILHPLR